MGGFTDPIVDGSGSLIVDRIHSDNYVATISGWDIEKTGAAEFQDMTARGDLSGSTLTIPANAGTGARLVIDSTGIKCYNASNVLVMEFVPDTGLNPVTPEAGIIVGAPGTMQLALFTRNGTGGVFEWFPNDPNWKAGALDVEILNPGQPFAISEVFLSPPAPASAAGGQGNMQLQFFSQSQDLVTNHAKLTVQSNDTAGPKPIANFLNDRFQVPVGTKFQVGNGEPGGYYTFNGTWTASSRASGSLSQITTVTQTFLDSDYAGNGFTGVSWKPSVAGYHDVYFFMNSVPGSTREAVIILKNGVEIAHNEAPNPTNLATVLLAEWLDPATDTLTFQPFFISGTTPQAMSGKLNIARRL